LIYADRVIPSVAAIASVAAKAVSPSRRRWFKYGEGIPEGVLMPEVVREYGERVSDGVTLALAKEEWFRTTSRSLAVGGVYDSVQK
jgi:hypothetical protein